MACGFAAHHANHGVERIAAGFDAQQFVAVVAQSERDVRIGQSEMTDHFGDTSGFGGIAFQEFKTRRRVEKQVAHDDFGARRAADFRNVGHRAALNGYPFGVGAGKTEFSAIRLVQHEGADKQDFFAPHHPDETV